MASIGSKKWRQYTSIAPFLGHCTDCIAPVGWTKVANRLVLRYNYNRVSDTLTKTESICLEKMLIPYVTILPSEALPIKPKEEPIKDDQGRIILDKNGNPILRQFFRNTYSGGGGSNSTHITFKKDGSIKKGLSL